MGLRETFQIIVDVATESGQKSLKDLRKEVGDAEGAFGKMKAAGGGGMDYIKDHATAFAAASGAALLAFGAKSLQVFEDTAKAALDLSTATGLNVEQASRWIGVGDDFQVSAETLGSSIGKIAKSITDTKWAEFGIQTRDASGKARDANDILIDTLAKLSGMTNETDRAAEGMKLFGKGFAGLSPLIGHTRDEYVSMLGAVEDGQVITTEEAAKAEKMRRAQDDLADAFKNVEEHVGEMAAGFAPAIELLAKFIALADKVGAFKPPAGNFAGLNSGLLEANRYVEHHKDLIESAHLNYDQWQVDISTGAKSLDQLMKALEDAGVLQNTNTDSLIRSTHARQEATDANIAGQKAAEDAAKATADATKSSEDHAKALENERNRLRDLYNEQLSQIDAQYAFEQKQRDLTQATRDMNDALGDNTKTTDEQSNAVERARQAAVDMAVAYATARGDVKGSQTAVDDMRNALILQAAQLDPESPLYKALQGYITKLGEIPKNIVPLVNFHSAANIAVPDGGTGQSNAADQFGAGLQNGYSPTYNVTVNGANMTPEQVVAAIKQYERKNGPGWKTSAI